MNEHTFFHTGDLGDAIASLPSVRAAGGGRYFISEKYEGQRESMRGDRFAALAPLLEAQPYISSVTWTEGFPPPNWKDFSTFRHNYHLHENLALQQARHIGQEISLEPWLSITEPVINGAIIARTLRYRNGQFPWRKILSRFPTKQFVGNLQEHREFVNLYGEIGFLHTPNLLELARVIAGASIVVTNQTCAWWIAAGLGVPAIQETFQADMNSVIDRPNLHYSRNAEEINQLIDWLQSEPSSSS